MAHLTT
ncbi:hypothetical protein D043_3211A, partial [Vibrio parahaemolyticus EKP-021]